jgi:hypothetical protein
MSVQRRAIAPRVGLSFRTFRHALRRGTVMTWTPPSSARRSSGSWPIPPFTVQWRSRRLYSRSLRCSGSRHAASIPGSAEGSKLSEAPVVAPGRRRARRGRCRSATAAMPLQASRQRAARGSLRCGWSLLGAAGRKGLPTAAVRVVLGSGHGCGSAADCFGPLKDPFGLCSPRVW